MSYKLDPQAIVAAKEHLAHQVSQPVGTLGQSLDELTTAAIADAVYGLNRTLEDTGLVAMLYPQDYSIERRGWSRHTAIPCVHQTEFFIEGSQSTLVSGEFGFLQLKERTLRVRRKRKDGRYQWFPKQARIKIGGEQIQAGADRAEPQSIPFGPFQVSELLGNGRQVPFEIPAMEDEGELKEDSEADIMVQILRSSDKLSGRLEIKARKAESSSNKFIITIHAQNNTPSVQPTRVNKFPKNIVARRCFFAAHTKAYVKDGKVAISLPNENQQMLQLTHNLNTFPIASASEENAVYSSPLIIMDYPRYEAVSMTVDLADLAAGSESILNRMDLLSPSEKETLRGERGETLRKIIVALANSNPDRIRRLYLFQWDAIQHFTKRLLNQMPGPFVIETPTASGKSLVFYVCAAMMSLLKVKKEGVTTFITFPTRALNSQQFSEMVGFVYHLNKQGLSIGLGLYMGKKDEAAVKSIDPRNAKDGDEIPNIERCPECGQGPFLARVISGKRIVPECNNCRTRLEFLYLSNYETERYCPTIVVGTPDKLVNSLTHNVYTHVLFGAPARRCPSCARWYPLCKKDQAQSVICCDACGREMGPETQTHSTPSLVIFDEVHTLTGTQGNLLGHFLSLMRVLKKYYTGDNEYWYIGGSATVANVPKLIENVAGGTPESILEFPNKAEFESKYFTLNRTMLRHRYIVLEPLARTTLGSVSWLTLAMYAQLKEKLKAGDNFSKGLLQSGVDATKAFRIQTVYVLRKKEGRDLEKYIADLSSTVLGTRPEIAFGHGDMSSEELASLNRRVAQIGLDVLLVTQIYGQGVDFPGLNLIHLFGTPRTFIEFTQVVGRTGRSGVPSLVFLHIMPPIPRDQWVYSNFRTAIGDLRNLLEPTPINVMNRYAVSLSVPNVFNTLVLARAFSDHQMRYCNHVARKLLANQSESSKLFSEIVEVYSRPWTPKSEMRRINQLAFDQVKQLLMGLSGVAQDTTGYLQQQQALIPTLRGRSKHVLYFEEQTSTTIDDIRATKDISMAALEQQDDGEEPGGVEA